MTRTKGPVARPFAQHLLCEPQHRERLARPLGVPEHAEPAPAFLDLVGGFEGVVHAEVLVVLGDLLDEAAGALAFGVDRAAGPRFRR